MESQESAVTVRLLIFSGRPDPEWTLDQATADQLSLGLREALTQENGSAPPPPPPRLGYRGFLVRPSRTAAELPQFTVFRGVLTVGAGGRSKHSRDVSGVENLLLAQARERGFGEALDVFGASPKDRTQGPASLIV